MRQSETPSLVLVAAIATNRAIGDRGRLLWRLPGDMRHFKSITMGKPVIIGRKTWDSIGRPLPGRKIIVVSRGPVCGTAQDVVAESSLDAAIARASALATQGGAGEIMVAGGGEIYFQTIDRASRLAITEVDFEPATADAFFPPINPNIWRQASRTGPLRGEGDDCDYSFVDYIRAA